MKTSDEIVTILRSISDVRLNSERELEVKFEPPSGSFAEGWEPISGYTPNSFTEQLLLLIEAELKGELK